MKKIMKLMLCSFLLFGCSSNKNEVDNDNNLNDSGKPQYNYDLDYVTSAIVGNWEGHGMYNIEVSEDGTYTWILGHDSPNKQLELSYRIYLESFTDYSMMIQHDPEFSDEYGVHVISVAGYGDLLVGQDVDGNYRLYFWGQKFTKVEE